MAQPANEACRVRDLDKSSEMTTRDRNLLEQPFPESYQEHRARHVARATHIAYLPLRAQAAWPISGITGIQFADPPR